MRMRDAWSFYDIRIAPGSLSPKRKLARQFPLVSGNFKKELDLCCHMLLLLWILVYPKQAGS